MVARKLMMIAAGGLFLLQISCVGSPENGASGVGVKQNEAVDETGETVRDADKHNGREANDSAPVSNEESDLPDTNQGQDAGEDGASGSSSNRGTAVPGDNMNGASRHETGPISRLVPDSELEIFRNAQRGDTLRVQLTGTDSALLIVRRRSEVLPGVISLNGTYPDPLHGTWAISLTARTATGIVSDYHANVQYHYEADAVAGTTRITKLRADQLESIQGGEPLRAPGQDSGIEHFELPDSNEPPDPGDMPESGSLWESSSFPGLPDPMEVPNLTEPSSDQNIGAIRP